MLFATVAKFRRRTECLAQKWCSFSTRASPNRFHAAPSLFLIQDEPGDLLSDGASAHLPAAAIPAIVSVFVDASSLRLWRAAPAVRPGMSSLDLEGSWHLKDRVGMDVSLGTLQVGLVRSSPLALVQNRSAVLPCHVLSCFVLSNVLVGTACLPTGVTMEEAGCLLPCLGKYPLGTHHPRVFIVPLAFVLKTRVVSSCWVFQRCVRFSLLPVRGSQSP